jgi:hypothetical protein
MGPRLFGSVNCHERSNGQYGDQKNVGLLENPKKWPIMCFAQDKKNNLLNCQNQRYCGIYNVHYLTIRESSVVV